ncbi:MAG: CAP domain-containing protein [Chloroflexota bacterium]
MARRLFIAALSFLPLFVALAQPGDDGATGPPNAVLIQTAIFEQMEPEERQILNDMNAARMRNGVPPLVPSRTLNQVAHRHAQWLTSRESINRTHIRDDNSTVANWIEQADYPSYLAANEIYAPDVIAIASSPNEGLNPVNFIDYWLRNPGEIISFQSALNGNNAVAFQSRIYREVGVAHSYRETTGYHFIVIVFASQPDVLPAVVIPHPPPAAYPLGSVITGRDVLVFVSNENAYPLGDGQSIGEITHMHISETLLDDPACPSLDALPPDWDYYSPEVIYDRLSAGDGHKVLHIHMCDDIREMVVTSVEFVVDTSGTIVQMEPPRIAPNPASDNINATLTAIASDAQALAEQQTQFELQQAAFEQTRTAFDSAALVTAQAVSTVAAQGEATLMAQAVQLRETEIALDARQIEISAGQTAQPTQPTPQPQTIIVTATPDAFTLDMATQVVQAQGTAVMLTEVSRKNPELFQAEINRENANRIAAQATALTATAGVSQNQPPVTPTPTPTPTLPPQNARYISLTWRDAFLVIQNAEATPVDISQLVLNVPGTGAISAAEFAQYGADVTQFAPGACLVIDRLDSPAVTASDLAAAGVSCGLIPARLAVGSGRVLWRLAGVPPFNVLDAGTLAGTCSPRDESTCLVPLGGAAVASDPQSTASPAQSPMNTLTLFWSPDYLLLVNTNDHPANLSGLTIESTLGTLNIANAPGINSANLQQIQPNACVLVYADDLGTAPELPSGVRCDFWPAISARSRAYLVWQPVDSFTVTAGGVQTVCPGQGTTRCAVSAP